MRELQDLARRLLESGEVAVVLGYEEGPRGVRPAFVRRPEDAGRLVFDERCVQNLAAYLSPRRGHVAALGRAAVVVKGCDARAVAGLLRESQVRREDLVLIGMRCGGVLADPSHRAALAADTVAPRCPGCAAREPQLADHVLGELPAAPPGAATRDARIAELDAMSPAGRWQFWQAEFARCVRCYACRQVCPMCFCERCVAEKSVPQWIESSPHARGNLSWHLTRALHEAGRCADCGECERACPAQIPLTLLTRKLALVIDRRFDFRVSDDPNVPAPIGTYRLDDAQEFIL
ncbi:MAG: 4Fe-4S dicluster domain-containing protein [Acidobacteria bacterium]|nr:4Fe-4S dicluster domain-containing protein [Acidobacteriota bacterium]